MTTARATNGDVARWSTGADARLATDVFGSGRSVYSLRLLADGLRRIIEQVGGKPPLIGASLGGLTTLAALGEEAPSRASVLVLAYMATRTKRKSGRRSAHSCTRPIPRTWPPCERGSFYIRGGDSVLPA